MWCLDDYINYCFHCNAVKGSEYKIEKTLCHHLTSPIKQLLISCKDHDILQINLLVENYGCYMSTTFTSVMTLADAMRDVVYGG